MADGMPLKDLGQAVGQVAGKTAPRALVKFEVEKQLMVPGGFEGQPDIIRPFFVVPEKGFEKLVCPFGVKEGFQAVRRKKGFK